MDGLVRLTWTTNTNVLTLCSQHARQASARELRRGGYNLLEVCYGIKTVKVKLSFGICTAVPRLKNPRRITHTEIIGEKRFDKAPHPRPRLD